MLEQIILWLSLIFTSVSIVGIACWIILRRQEGLWRAEMRALETRLRTEIAKLEDRPAPVTQETAPALRLVEDPPARVGSLRQVGATTRSKVLKMHRLGQSPVQIAGALELPTGQVDLLLKVHEVSMRACEIPPPATKVIEPAEKNVDFWLSSSI